MNGNEVIRDNSQQDMKGKKEPNGNRRKEKAEGKRKGRFRGVK